MDLSFLEKLAICPDCVRNRGQEIFIKRSRERLFYCPSCLRNFYADNNFIDLLPRRPVKIAKKVNSLFRDFYTRQYNIRPEQDFVRPDVWGKYEELNKGYQIFLEKEWDIIKSTFPVSPSNRKFFCDISGANGFFSFRSSIFFDLVIFCDISLEYISWARREARRRGLKNIVFVRADYFCLPFASNSLDFVLSTDTFIYYGKDRDRRAIASLYRKISPGGVFCFDFHSRKFYAPAKRIYEYTREDLEKIKKRFPFLQISELGKVPTFLTPSSFLFELFSKLFFFLPPIRYICFLKNIPNDYFGDYDSLRRWASYWYQVKTCLSFKPRSVLVVGVGNSLVVDYFKKVGVYVKTLDIDESLYPDYLLDISDTSLMSKIRERFDIVLCCQVLEHISFSRFSVALRNIGCLSNRGAVLSLPNLGLGFSFTFNFPLDLTLSSASNFLLGFRKKAGGEHRWEIDRKNFNLKKIRSLIINSGFVINDTFLVPQNPYHRFFVLGK